MSGEGGAIAEAAFDALDAKHDQAYHFHAAECCWPIPDVTAVLADLLAAERQRGREEALREAADRVRSRREAFLDSPSLDRAWIAGWHAATDDHAAALADVPAAAEADE